MKREFILTKIFDKILQQQKDPDVLQRKIEDKILANTEVGDVVAGTGGVRKFRVPDGSRNKGTRGGFRVWFVDFPKKAKAWLLVLYDKDQKDDLTKAEKAAIKELVETLGKE